MYSVLQKNNIIFSDINKLIISIILQYLWVYNNFFICNPSYSCNTAQFNETRTCIYIQPANFSVAMDLIMFILFTLKMKYFPKFIQRNFLVRRTKKKIPLSCHIYFKSPSIFFIFTEHSKLSQRRTHK